MTKLEAELEEAFSLQQNNQLDEAMAIFKEVLSHVPHQPDALHGLGMIYAQQKQFDRAIPYFQRAIRQAPSVAEFHNNLANAYKALGKIDQALMHYHEALRLKTPYPQAHNNLGNLLYRIGRIEEAADHFRKSLRMDPESVNAHFNLAITLVKLDNLVDAVSHFQEVLKRRPDHLGAMHNLGIAFCVLKQFSDSEPLLLEAIKREPTNIDALFHLGVVQTGLGKLDEAKKQYEAILLLDKDHANTHHNLATLYIHLDNPAKAMEHYQKALEGNPNNETAKHMLAALSGETLAEGAPLEYSRALFNQYAYSYNQHVKINLRYQVPYRLRQAITPFANNIKTPWKALDLGCGTGLCAPLFIDIVGHLTGVDLSENMIALAKQQGGYHKLVVSDIISYLEHKFNEFDLIISADVFVYFGDLHKIFELTRQALKPEGLFCFSIETLTEAEIEKKPQFPDYQVRPTGRYAHRLAYIQTLAAENKYVILSQSSAILRYQDDLPVEGTIVILKKQSYST